MTSEQWRGLVYLQKAQTKFVVYCFASLFLSSRSRSRSLTSSLCALESDLARAHLSRDPLWFVSKDSRLAVNKNTAITKTCFSIHPSILFTSRWVELGLVMISSFYSRPFGMTRCKIAKKTWFLQIWLPRSCKSVKKRKKLREDDSTLNSPSNDGGSICKKQDYYFCCARRLRVSLAKIFMHKNTTIEQNNRGL